MNNAKLIDSRVASAFYGRFQQLKPNQDATIQPLLSGANLVLTSGTGSGKTEAVLAPLVSKYWRGAVVENSLFLLYIAPTKALVNDIHKRINPPLALLNLRVGIRHGDRDDLRSGPVPHVLITTPESLDVMLCRNDQALMNVKAVVIDEVHLLYNTQRGLQLSILLKRLRLFMERTFQWAALSATVGDLSYIRDFLMGSEEDAVFIDFPPTRSIDAHIVFIKNMVDFVVLIGKLTKGRSVKLLVFTNSRRECEVLSGALQKVEKFDKNVFTHYSSLSNEVRLDVEKKFASQQTAICIATSTLELGIDIGDIDAVILWGLPSGIDSFLQRIGRSNRRSKKTNVICMIPDNSTKVAIDAVHFLTLIDAASKGELPVQEPFELFGAVGQQCLSVIASWNGRFTRITDLLKILDHKSHISRETTENILAELAHNGFLQKHGFKNQYGADEQLYKLIDMKLIYGNFGWGSQSTVLYYGTQLLGEVPAVNLLRVKSSNIVRFAGRNWIVKKASHTGFYLEPTKVIANVIDFTYGGSKISSAPGTINRIWEMLHSDNLQTELIEKSLVNKVSHYISQIKSQCSMNNIPFCRTDDGYIYFTFAGNIINRAICLFSKQIIFETDDYQIKTTMSIDWTSISTRPLDYDEIFEQLFEETEKQSIYQKQLPINLQKHEYLQSWLKDKDIPIILERLKRSAPKETSSAVFGLLDAMVKG